MADDIDLANLQMDNEITWALKKIRQNAGQVVKGTKHCMECGDDMPEARQTLGFKFCVPCASERERRKSLFAED